MPDHIFHNKKGFAPTNCKNDEEAIACIPLNPDVFKIEFAPTGRIVWELEKPELPPQYSHYFAFQAGHAVKKTSGYVFNGEVRAAFLTKRNEVRYVVELITEPPGGNGDSMLHIFNEGQLERAS